jgi:protein O-GlcNAc transferase
MNIEQFVLDLNDGKYEHPSDAINRAHSEITGFSAPCLMAILSLAVQNLGEQELYLEIGTMMGRTLVGAMVDNPDKRAVSVDNFSAFEYGSNEEHLFANMEKFGIADRVEFFREDSLTFLKNHEALHKRIGVYFYDGDHNTEAGLENLCKAIPYLADNAVIILDDFSGPGVWRSVQQFIALYVEQARLLFCMGTNDFPFPNAKWWNGIVVIGWTGLS